MKKRVHFLILGLVLLSCCVSGAAIYRYRLAMFTWDDSEYLLQAIDIFDSLTSRGYLGWPSLVARGQHFAKPPLYVNTLAAAMAWTGRDRPFLAVALTAWATEALLLAAVFTFVASATTWGYGVLAALAIAGMPAVARWAGTAYPDVQLSALVVWTLALLTSQPIQERPFFPFVLGATLGLGMLSKMTFPALVVFPLAYWLVAGARSPLLGWARLKAFLAAVLVALTICSIWYGTNVQEAFHYAKTSLGFSLGPLRPFSQRVLDWSVMLLIGGIGTTALFSGAVILSGKLLIGGRRLYEHPRSVHAVILAVFSSVPSLVVAVTSPIPPNTRHSLPGIVALALALFLLFARLATSLERHRMVSFFSAALLLIQMVMVQSLALPPVSKWIRTSSAKPLLATLVPSLKFQPISLDALRAVLDYAERHTALGARIWYLSGNDAMLNVPRLDLAARLQKIPVDFDYGCYFTWSEEKCIETLSKARTGPTMVVVYQSPLVSLDPEVSYMNRHAAVIQQFLEDPANRFERLETQRSGEISYYSDDSFPSR